MKLAILWCVLSVSHLHATARGHVLTAEEFQHYLTPAQPDPNGLPEVTIDPIDQLCVKYFHKPAQVNWVTVDGAVWTGDESPQQCPMPVGQ